MTDFQGSTYVDSLMYITDLEKRIHAAKSLVFMLTPGTEEYIEVVRLIQRTWKELVGTSSETEHGFAQESYELSNSGYKN